MTLDPDAIKKIANYEQPEEAIAALLLFLEHQTDMVKKLEEKVDCLDKALSDHLQEPVCRTQPQKIEENK